MTWSRCVSSITCRTIPDTSHITLPVTFTCIFKEITFSDCSNKTNNSWNSLYKTSKGKWRRMYPMNQRVSKFLKNNLIFLHILNSCFRCLCGRDYAGWEEVSWTSDLHLFTPPFSSWTVFFFCREEEAGWNTTQEPGYWVTIYLRWSTALLIPMETTDIRCTPCVWGGKRQLLEFIVWDEPRKSKV